MSRLPEPRRGERAIDYLRRLKGSLQSTSVVSMTGVGSISSHPGGTVLHPRGGTFPWSLLSFGYALAGNQLTIHAGSVRLHGIGNYSVAETIVTLTGATEWIYVQQLKSSGAGTIEHSATEPLSNTTHRRLPLYLFEANAGVYSLSRICHMGDFNFDTPIA